MKVLLAYLCNYHDRHDYYLSLLPVGLVSLAAYSEREGFDITLANFSKIGYRQAIDKIVEMRPAVLGVSIFTHNRADSLKLIRGIKKRLPRITIIAGGPHASHLADLFLERVPEMEYLIQGEGEQALARLLHQMKAGKRPSRGIIPGIALERLDELPHQTAFSGNHIGIDPHEQYKVLVTSRGCGQRCVFCCSPAFWGARPRLQSASAMVDAIAHAAERYGIMFFSIRDDNFTVSKKRVMEFSHLLRKRRLFIMWNCQSRVDTVDEEMLIAMKQAGLEQIQLGVESGSPRILERYQKNSSIPAIERAAAAARRVGVYLFYYLMAGMDGETDADIRKTVALVRRSLPGDGLVSPVALYPGTALCHEAQSDKRITDETWFSSDAPGIFLRNDERVADWCDLVSHELLLIRERSWYNKTDYKNHRAVCGDDCWVTDILEGDYYLDAEKFMDAESCYARVTARYPDNPWGYMRLGKLFFSLARFDSSEEQYRRVIELAPAYYGGWLKRAEAALAQGKRELAQTSIEEAYRRNRFDKRITHIRGLLARSRAKSSSRRRNR